MRLSPASRIEATETRLIAACPVKYPGLAFAAERVTHTKGVLRKPVTSELREFIHPVQIDSRSEKNMVSHIEPCRDGAVCLKMIGTG